MLEVTQLDHVQITVSKDDEAACKAFYGSILGLPELKKPPMLRNRGGAWYHIGNAQLHLSLEETATTNRQSKRHICLVVANLAGAAQHFGSAGVQVVPDDEPIPGWARFYLRDPGGNRIEIAQHTEV